jgi:hypothetical protein
MELRIATILADGFILSVTFADDLGSTNVRPYHACGLVVATSTTSSLLDGAARAANLQNVCSFNRFENGSLSYTIRLLAEEAHEGLQKN